MLIYIKHLCNKVRGTRANGNPLRASWALFKCSLCGSHVENFASLIKYSQKRQELFCIPCNTAIRRHHSKSRRDLEFKRAESAFLTACRTAKTNYFKPFHHSRWKSMRERCETPKSHAYHRYGARGIEVCPRWHVFLNFCEDIGLPPFPYAQLDRIDNNGDYEPGNVRWVGNFENQFNRDEQHRPRAVLADGKRYRSIRQCAKELGTTEDVIRNRCVKQIKGFSFISP